MKERADVNYFRSTFGYNVIYEKPLYPLTSIRDLQARVQYGISSLATTEEVGVPMLRMNNLQNDGWKLDDLKYIQLSEKDLALYRLQPGDILFNRTNSKELVGKCEVFAESGDWVFASYLMRLTVNEKTLPEFVSAFLNTSPGRAQIDRVSRQIVGMSNINAEELRELVVPLPPLEIQRQLVAELETARALRRERLAQADALLAGLDGWLLEQLGLQPPAIEKRGSFGVKLGDIRGSRMDFAFHSSERNGVVASSYGSAPLRELAQFVSGGTPTKDEGDFWNGSIPWVSPKDFGPHILSDSEDHISEAGLKAAGLHLLPKETVLVVVRSGVLKHTLPVTLTDCEVAINQDLKALVLRPNAPIIPQYLAAYLSVDGQRLLPAITKHSTTVQSLNTPQLEELAIPLPPIETQTIIANEVRRRRDDARLLRSEADAGWNTAKTQFETQLLGGTP